MGGEEREHFAWFGMSADISFRVQHLIVDDDIEDAGRPGDQREFIDEMLIVVNETVGRAHGAV